MERRLMIALGVILLAGVAYLGYQRFAGGQNNVRVQSCTKCSPAAPEVCGMYKSCSNGCCS